MAAVVGLQSGIALTMRVGLFPVISTIAILPILERSPAPAIATMDTIPLTLFGLVAAWNVGLPVPKWFTRVMRTVRLDQKWNMFAPTPWVHETPKMISAPNVRWRKFHSK